MCTWIRNYNVCVQIYRYEFCVYRLQIIILFSLCRFWLILWVSFLLYSSFFSPNDIAIAFCFLYQRRLFLGTPYFFFLMSTLWGTNIFKRTAHRVLFHCLHQKKKCLLHRMKERLWRLCFPLFLVIAFRMCVFCCCSSAESLTFEFISFDVSFSTIHYFLWIFVCNIFFFK